MLLIVNVTTEELDQLFSFLILILDEPINISSISPLNDCHYLAVVPFLNSFIRPPSILSQM